MPIANQTTREFAHVSGGEPLNMLIESVANKSTTAHILGGAVIAASAAQGVIDTHHELFGHPGLYVVDASAIPVNLGVNPSLTITALAERFASLIPPANAAEPDRFSVSRGVGRGEQGVPEPHIGSLEST